MSPRPGENFIDATLGGGGHASAILKATSPDGKLLGIDLNEKAFDAVEKLFSGEDLKNRIIFVHDNFSNLQNIVGKYKFDKIQGIVADLGFSSIELEESGRGFSFLKDEPLIMAYGKSPASPGLQPASPSQGGRGEQIVNGSTAAQILNGWSEEELSDIFFKYSEEKFSRQIARRIVESRKIKPIVTTFQLVDVIKQATPVWYHHRHIHPATKVFQALRIAVNAELENLEKFLPQAFDALGEGGRLAIISFHSLEDRIVKNFFREKKQQGLADILTKKAVRPSVQELKINPRSRSAKMRALAKL